MSKVILIFLLLAGCASETKRDEQKETSSDNFIDGTEIGVDCNLEAMEVVGAKPRKERGQPFTGYRPTGNAGWKQRNRIALEKWEKSYSLALEECRESHGS